MQEQERYTKSNISYNDLARDYRVCKSSIAQIINCKAYKYVD